MVYSRTNVAPCGGPKVAEVNETGCVPLRVPQEEVHNCDISMALLQFASTAPNTSFGSAAARATMLLANNEPSDSHRAFLGKKARELTAAVLKVFWPSAKGSLHHACCVLDYLLRSYADEVGNLALASKSLPTHRLLMS